MCSFENTNMAVAAAWDGFWLRAIVVQVQLWTWRIFLITAEWFATGISRSRIQQKERSSVDEHELSEIIVRLFNYDWNLAALSAYKFIGRQ